MTTWDGSPTSRRVLVVDDCVDTVRMMKLMLKRAGFEVRTAHDGPSALATARDFLPAVVLLDLTLPGMTGQEVAAALRADQTLADALIVAISGYGDQGIPPGFDDLLVKPLDHDALLKLLQNGAQGRTGK